ncbi:30S ribosomal protein S16 [Candidatus Peregrinibacteria bacterium]|nr:30S ribosomal protein S16 [Candidatus Peregrinibacteria bacterium]
MLRIRLQRTGTTNNPSYRIVVAQSSDAAKGRHLEILGHFLPAGKPVKVEVDAERVTHWISVGAIPTDTMARLLVKQGVKGMEKYVKRYTKKRSKKAQPEGATAPAAEKPSAEVPASQADGKEGGDTAK